jgi:hypothetical protein
MAVQPDAPRIIASQQRDHQFQQNTPTEHNEELTAKNRAA